jgi:hypothetical protein
MTKVPVPLNVNAVDPLITPALTWLELVAEDVIVRLASLFVEPMETAPDPALIDNEFVGKATTTVPATPEPEVPEPYAPPPPEP